MLQWGRPHPCTPEIHSGASIPHPYTPAIHSGAHTPHPYIPEVHSGMYVTIDYTLLWGHKLL